MFMCIELLNLAAHAKKLQAFLFFSDNVTGVKIISAWYGARAAGRWRGCPYRRWHGSPRPRRRLWKGLRYPGPAPGTKDAAKIPQSGRPLPPGGPGGGKLLLPTERWQSGRPGTECPPVSIVGTLRQCQGGGRKITRGITHDRVRAKPPIVSRKRRATCTNAHETPMGRRRHKPGRRTHQLPQRRAQHGPLARRTAMA